MLGFTKQEQGIILFLVFSFLVGGLVTLYQRYFKESTLPQVDPAMVKIFNDRIKEINRQERDSITHIKTISKSDRSQPSIEASNQTQKSSQTRKPTKTVEKSLKKFLINVNVATEEELQNLPRIGPSMARRIVEYRQKNGKFNRLEDLLNVKGIGEKTLSKIKPFITLK